MNKTTRSYLLSFVGGGVFAVLAELIYKLVGAIGVRDDLHTIVMLAVVALLGCVAELFGLYSKLDFFSFGAILPFCGMTGSIVSSTYESLKNGSGFKGAYCKGVGGMTKVFILGIPAAIVIAAVAALI